MYMEHDLAAVRASGDWRGECRALGNLATAHCSKGNHAQALTMGRSQLVLALKYADKLAAASALTTLGKLLVVEHRPASSSMSSAHELIGYFFFA